MALNHLRLLQPLLCRSLISRSRLVVTAVVNVRPSACPGTVHLPAAACRFYGTKKDKAKGPSAKVNIKSALVEDIIDLEELKEEMAAVVYALKDDFTRSLSIRTSPGALDHIIVVTGDGKFPLNELGQISMKSSHLLIVNMSNFPEAVTAATRALRECSMNLNPEVDGTIIKVAIPKVSREHRENLAKLAKQLSNKAKESLRSVRSNAVSQVKKSKEGHSEDILRLIEKQIQQMTDDVTAEIDKQLAVKTKELLG
uniref:Ribosome-recycling factor, mitochondrial n=1 Tax=Oryzias latipes TaxID=8090 RepID=A0A3P9M8V0_ORYLA